MSSMQNDLNTGFCEMTQAEVVKVTGGEIYNCNTIFIHVI